MKVARFTAFLDASVLYPAAVRNILLEIATADLYFARWSNAVHDEWTNALLRDRPDLTAEQLQRTRTLMNRSVRDALVEGFEPLIEGLSLPDPNDRHVLAAAINGHADVIVTANLKIFQGLNCKNGMSKQCIPMLSFNTSFISTSLIFCAPSAPFGSG